MELQVANKLRSESQHVEQVIRSRYHTPIYATMVCDIYFLSLFVFTSIGKHILLFLLYR